MKEITYEMLEKANGLIRSTDIKGKEYAEVNQRIKAFRYVYPDGFIKTETNLLENGLCVMTATVGYYDENGQARILGQGTAYEKENSSFINKTSFIENCETSAVGRALGMAGFGIDVSVASYEEVANAVNNQTEKATEKQLEILKRVYTGENLTKLLQVNNIPFIEQLSKEKASALIEKLKGEK